MTNRAVPLSTASGLLVLRLRIGGCMLSHGVDQLRVLLGGAEFADPIGIGNFANLLLVTGAEFAGIGADLLGGDTRFARLLEGLDARR